MFIKSENNELIKKIKKLKDKKERYEEGLFFVEGTTNVLEALNSNFEIEYIVMSESFKEDIPFKKDKIVHTTDSVFKKISDTVTPQMIMAVIKIPEYDENIYIKENGIYVIADNVQDPGNLGTIIRSADAFGATAVFTINNSVDVFNPKVLRATMGSIFHIPVIPTSKEVVLKLKAKGIKVFATHLRAKKLVHQCNIDDKVAFVLGNESKGVSIEDLVDDFVKIPMTGEAESLNVSIAAAIFLYESQRQRLIKQE
ncbi:tRNA/rRNA methyltransferase SpoU [Thermoanaerobacter kivui]|uniref:tRNA/rRNA methyltransferase SpoU n=1 Tax=Thermoanaerobacter kivui TaxID=2325 RepID=A0A097ASF2_THEKI|nr:RNA methyltransferase [Thermoanaerobacter kivui]AIS52750.1 tRNA/rRNA methyltransferase SpoU [Thermoanaerobacter kivui]